MTQLHPPSAVRRMGLTFCLVMSAALTLVGCDQIAGAPVDQSTMCIAATDDEAFQCAPGAPFFFKPNTWGNEQLPLAVAALYCDTNRPITHNPTGVICTFTDKRLRLLQGQ